MGTELALPKNFGNVSKIFANQQASNDELGSGVASSYGIIGYRGKVWSIKYQGKETQLMRDDGDGPRGSVEVVIVKAAAPISKIFYANGYQDGSNAAPDCWSTNGVTPDAAAQNKQNATCAGCPMNAWGSRVTESGKQGKACSDSRRIAVVPVNDMANDMFGGPMLLRIPAASLKDLKQYGELLNSYHYPYYACATRISFDPKEAYPKFVFSAIRPLTDEEATMVMDLRDDKRVGNILNEATDIAPRQEMAAPVPSSPFEQPPTTVAPSSAPKTAPASTAGAKKAPAPKIEPAPAQAAPASFDEMLDNIL
jgi:hypothetical protein